jgi:uncharacterized protein
MKTIRKILTNKLTGIKNKLTLIKAEPYKISMSYALGVFLAATPFIGIKIIIAIALTLIFKLNRTAAVIGVLHINILTAPIFYGFSFIIGKAVIGSDAAFNFSWPITIRTFYEIVFTNPQVFLSLIAGGITLGFPMAIAAYYFSISLIRHKISINPNAL